MTQAVHALLNQFSHEVVTISAAKRMAAFAFLLYFLGAIVAIIALSADGDRSHLLWASGLTGFASGAVSGVAYWQWKRKRSSRRR